jgi:uncharacterized protein (TIGR00266 family)
MSNNEYNVVLSGHINRYADQESVLKAFIAAFADEASKAASFFKGKPTVYQSGLTRKEAERYEKIILNLGAEVTIESANKTESTIEDEVSNSEASNASRLAGLMQSDSAGVNSLDVNNTEVNSIEEDSNGVNMANDNARELTATQSSPSGFSYHIDGAPDFAYVTVQIPANEMLKVEASAMATMDTHVSMKTKMRGGLGRLVTGESIFLNEFSAEGAPGEVGIAPGAPGDLDHVYLDDETIYLQNSAYVASTAGIAVETKWQGLTKGFFSGESLFLIRCLGKGDLWFSSYGGIINIDVDGDYVVDSGNIVAFTEGLDYKVSKVGGYKSLFFSGEGFVCRFSGKGKVWLQTRKVGAFAAWLSPFRPAKRSN